MAYLFSLLHVKSNRTHTRLTLSALALWLIIASGLSAVSCNRPAQTESAAKRFCDSLDTEFESAEDLLGSVLWLNLRKGLALDSLQNLRRSWFGRLNSSGALGQIDNFQKVVLDSLTVRRLRVARQRILGSLLENDPEISLIVDSLQRTALADLPEPPDSFNELNSDTIPLLYRRRELYRKLTGSKRDHSSAIVRLARLRNQSCQELGYNSLLDLKLSLSGISRDELSNTLATLDSATAGSYRSLLKRIGDSLSHHRLEEADISFYEFRVTHKFRRSNSRSSALEFALRTVTQIGIDIRYQSVFVDSVSGLIGAPFMVAPHPPEDIRLLYKTSKLNSRIRAGADEIECLLMELGKSVQLLAASGAPYLLRASADPLWGQSLGQLFVSLLDRRALQKDVAKILKDEFELYEAAIADVRLLRLRRLLSLVHFELALYDNPNRDLGEVYNKIVNDILYVKPDKQYQYWTSQRDLLFNPATRFARIYSQIIAAQIYSTALREHGTLVNNPMFGPYLQEVYFASGSRLDWPELVLLGTGERLDLKYYLDKIAPGSIGR